MTHYVELQVLTHFSLLRGASSPEELFAAAALLGYPAIGVSDIGTVGGVVRAWEAQKATGVRSIAGTRVDLSCGRRLLLYPTDRPAWSRITRLLTVGKKRAGKGGCLLHWHDLEPWSEGVVAILLPHEADEENVAALKDLKAIYGRRGYMALFQRRRPGDAVRIDALARQAGGAGVRAVVTGDVLYHAPEARLLQDVVTAVREKCTVDELGYRREVNADRALKSPDEMVRRFRAYPDALQASVDIARICTFDLGELAYQYPHERLIEGLTAQEALQKLATEAVERMFDGNVPEAYTTQIAHEMRLIGELGYAPYFLTVYAIVREARRRGILCQGRGSAANSCVCFVLGVTSIDPIKHELLFERFVSGERREPPDIDVDFEHERREEIIQWIYETYGRDRAALTAVVTRYRARGAVRDVGKALGLPEDLTSSLAGLVWGWSAEGVGEKQVDELNLDIADRRLRLTLDLARKLIGVPRHMSQHPGGFVLTHDRLDDLVPIEPPHLPESLPAIGAEAVEGIAVGQLLDRGALCARPAPDIFNAVIGRGAARGNDLGPVSVREAADHAQAKPHRQIAPACPLERAIPATGVDARWPHLDAMLARIADDLCRRVEAHGLRVHQRGAEHVRMMMLHPATRIGDLGEAGGVALGEAVGTEALKLAEGALGEVARVAACDHTLDQLLAEMADPAGEFEGRHGAAQLVCLGRGEARADNGDLHGLLLKQGHAQRLFQHGAQLRARVFRALQPLTPAQIRVDHVALDRPGPHNRDLDHEVIEAPRLHARQHAHLRAALDLEGAERVRLLDHGVDVGVIVLQVGQPDPDALVLFKEVEGSVHAAEHPQSENVDLHKFQ